MASLTYVYNYDGTLSFQLSKWKIRVGSQLFYNSTILSYKKEGSTSDPKEPLLKYKSNVGGTVTELLVSEGDIVQSGTAILKVQPCTHPVIMKDLCAECGTDLRSLDRDNFEKLTAAASFSMVHVVPELKVSLEQAEQLGRDDEDRLLKNRKLVLLVDLDQTLIHTTNDNIPEKLPDVCHFQLYGCNSPWYHTKLRPGTSSFLENISKYYELHICTFGARLYAHKIANMLDPNGKFFSHRILSRDECFDATSKTANLKALFPRGDHMVCIIDDREDVWNFAPNVIHVKPYTYFRNTGDINAPPIPVFSKAESSLPTKESSSVADVKEENSTIDKLKSESSEETKLDCKSSTEMKSINFDTKSKEIKDIKTINKSSEEIECPISDNKSNKEMSNIKYDNKANEEMECIEPNTKSSEEMENINSKHKSSKETEDVKSNKEIENVDVCVTLQKSSNIESKNKISNCDQENDASSESKLVENDLIKLDNANSKTDNLSTDFVECDDYLLYLEEILIRVHTAYYDLYEKVGSKKCIPDLKDVVPDVRKKALKNVNIVFSSIIPTNCIPESHHFWKLAESLGASVTRELILDSSKQQTTHVVASKSGTAKVNAAKRHSEIWVVTLDWLLCCDERWEHADERMFLLSKDTSVESEIIENAIPKHRQFKRKKSSAKGHLKTGEEKFSETVFADLGFSKDEIEDMDREIEEACSEESDEESQNCSGSSSDSSSSVESLSSGDYPKGWKKKRRTEMLEEALLKEIAEESSDVETIGSVDEEMAEAVKQEFQDF